MYVHFKLKWMKDLLVVSLQPLLYKMKKLKFLFSCTLFLVVLKHRLVHHVRSSFFFGGDDSFQGMRFRMDQDGFIS